MSVDTERVTESRAAEIFESVKGWGRWGADDERGALNLITPELVSTAATLVRLGRVVACGRELATVPAVDNPMPALHHMTGAGDLARTDSLRLQASSDFVGVAFHGMAVSHIDALCHVFVDGLMYNGFPASDVTSIGARHNSIAAASAGVVGRGVLLDIPRLRGVDWLEPEDVIMAEELEEACTQQSVSPRSGDILIVSTGRDARRVGVGRWDPNTVGLAGLDPECIPWLLEKDPAVLGSDGVSDPLPPNPHRWSMPVHQCLLVGMGVHLLDNLDLLELSEACAVTGRWEFLFVASPLAVRGGTGSPLNPVAVL